MNMKNQIKVVTERNWGKAGGGGGAGEMEKNTQAHEKAAMDVSPSLEWKQGASKRVAAAI